MIFKKKQRYPVTIYEKSGDKYNISYSIFEKTDKGFYDKKNKRYIAYPPIVTFRNYKDAIKFLKRYINQKTILSNYEPSDVDRALMKLFQSRAFLNKLKGGLK